AGSVSRNFPIGAWDPYYKSAVLYSQLISVHRGLPLLSYGRKVTFPTTSPGPSIKRLWAKSRNASAGTLQNLGAVFKIDF
ncbi:MAG: hypothetical protein QF412_07125, partial [Planctomycetota bacterium]|nr:hypothetical protein [Planctomycetota bacterium]